MLTVAAAASAAVVVDANATVDVTAAVDAQIDINPLKVMRTVAPP